MNRLVSWAMVITLLMNVFALAFFVQPARATGTIYIRSDGSIDPPTAPIQRNGDTYALTDNINDPIIVEKGDIIFNGNGYTVQVPGRVGNGFSWSDINNVTIKNTKIKGCLGHGVYIYSSCNNSISGNSITANSYNAVYLYSSCNNSISGNNIADNAFAAFAPNGIYLQESCNYNIISGNNITNNGRGIGLYSSCNYNNISRNNITANVNVGIKLEASSNYNNINGNNIANGGYGILLYPSSNNSICGNNIANNMYGIWLTYVSPDYGSPGYSNYNMVYHNNFIGNAEQVHSFWSMNIWDDGYPSGGNYWSDYTGVDSNGDGIGDTPYVIDANNQDRYPLVNPWSESFPARIVGHTISLDSGNMVRAVLNATMLSQFLHSAEIKCCLVVVDTTGSEVYNNFAGIGGPQDYKNTVLENNTIASVEFTFLLEELHQGTYAYIISIWSFNREVMYDSTDWLYAFEVHSWPVYVRDLGTLYADSYLDDNTFVLLKRFESVNYTFRLAESVTDLSVKVFDLLSSDFACAMNASNAQMDLHGGVLPHFNLWYNVPENTYMMNLRVKSSSARLARVVIQAGSKIESPSIKVIGVEPKSIFATPSGTMTYKVDVWVNATTHENLVLTATLGGQVLYQTYTIEPFKPGRITAYMTVNAPPEIGQYTVDFNASVLNLGIFDTAAAPLNVDSTTYNITVSPTLKYYKESIRLDVWNGPRKYVSDPSKLNALDVTNVKITSVDERNPETGKPSKVSLSFDAANKEYDIHHVVQVKIGSDTYTLGTVIYGDEPRKIEAHNIPVVNDKVSFTIIYRKWSYGNFFEVGTKFTKAIITTILPIAAPGYSAVWFATGDVAMQLAKYTMLYAGQIWTDQENGYMTTGDATRIIESSGVQQSDFLPFLTTAVGVTCNSFSAFLATVDFLHKSGKLNPWNYARACIAGFKHILDNAEARLLDILVTAFGKAAVKLGITLAAKEVVKQAFNAVLNVESFLQVLGGFLDWLQAIGNGWSLLWSPSEEGKEVSDAQIGADPAEKVDPVVSMSFEGQVNYTNDTCFGDTLNMNFSFGQTQAQAILEVDCNLTAVYLTLLSDSAFRSSIFSNLGFNATQTSLAWQSENSAFVLEATGSPYKGLLGLAFWMNSTFVQGIEIASVDALQVGDAAWLNGSLLYPFGKDLEYNINVTLPNGSLFLQVLSDGNFTIRDNTVTWNTTIDQLAIQFIPPNVNIIEAVSAKTVIGQGYCSSVNLTVANQGTCTQIVNVTAYANATAVQTQFVILESGILTAVTLIWSTTDLAKGNYTLSVYVWPVFGEMNTSDNTLFSSWVLVSIPGDVNADKKVDLKDVFAVGKAYGSIAGDPRFKSNLDINSDGIIDLKDYYATCKNYGKSW